jgi:Mg-chelatase subunit ChlD
VTSRGFDEAKLGVNADDWPAFLRIVEQEALKLFPEAAVRSGLQMMFEEQKAELCIGIVCDDMSEAALARKKIRDAGFGHVETTAALLHCRGNADRALDLLVSGWQPDALAPSHVDFGGAGACPFLRQRAAASGAASAAASAPGTPTARVGRVLDNKLQLQLDLLLVEEADLCCPVTLLLFCEPVIASDGCVYEHLAIQELIQTGVVSPVTMQPLTPQLTAARQQKEAVDAFMRVRTQELLNFAFTARKQGEPHMAKMALERAGEYIAQLTPSAVPEMAQAFETMLRDAGLSVPRLDNAFARINQVLRVRIQQVTAELAVQHEEDSEGDGKSVLFCIDVSGSMSWQIKSSSQPSLRGPRPPSRLDKARENCLKIFDEYLEDSDEVCLVTFDSHVQVDVPLKHVGGSQAQLRGELDAKLRSTRGTTQFFDALCASEKVLRSGKPGVKQWIVALTDGATANDSATIHDTINQLRASPGKPDLIVVGVDLDRNYIPVLNQLAEVTPASLFIDASGGVQALDEAFEQVAEMICD